MGIGVAAHYFASKVLIDSFLFIFVIIMKRKAIYFKQKPIFAVMLLRNLILLGVITLLSFSCKRGANFEKRRLEPDVQKRLEWAYQYYEQAEYQKAQYLFEDLMGTVRGSADQEKIYYYFAYTHYFMRNYNFAAYYFKQFYNTFPNSELAEEALFMSAESYFKLSPNYRLTQEDTEKAIEGYQLFVNSYPNSERISIGNEKIDKLRVKLEEKELENAKGYFRRRNYMAAKHCFNNLLADFPDTNNAEFVRFMILKSTFWYAQESILSKQVERYQEVIKDFEVFKRKHSKSVLMKDAQNFYEISKQRIKKIRNE